MPFTRLCEWIWCATQVSGTTFVEMLIFSMLLLSVMTLAWHVFIWQKKVSVMLLGIQTQIQDLTFCQQRLMDDATTKLLEIKADLQQHLLDELYEQCHVLSQFFQPTNMQVANAKVVAELVDHFRNLMAQLDPNLPSGVDGLSTAEDLKLVKQQLAALRDDDLTKLQALITAVHKSTNATAGDMHVHVSEIHKVLNAGSGDLGKLGAIMAVMDKVTETYGLAMHLKNSMAVKQDVADNTDRLRASLEKKLEDLVEKTAVMRVVLDQNKDKILSNMKDGHGWLSKQTSDIIGLIRGQGGITGQQKSLIDLVWASKEASTYAQEILNSCSESVANCEDRLHRLEPLIMGIVDQQNETDTGMRMGLEALQAEMPALQEILQRLPKLPTRKPPSHDKPVDQPAASSSQQPPSQPTTPPVSLGPASAPTVIPVHLDQPNHGGIQLRLSEHVGALQAPAPSPQAQQQQPHIVIGGSTDGRHPNFLITPLPAQPSTSSDLLRAMLR